ncbi:polyprenyl synthetase family protein [Bacillus seohaeanensis]|jgi:geranylgeranyl diphosphate synthase, type II|uniref:Polyprenyl synthetase family protein n=1 Tax=Bacillus seohaeanensis TaxID=284580 RepID=A0ABW5RR73_9BACI
MKVKNLQKLDTFREQHSKLVESEMTNAIQKIKSPAMLKEAMIYSVQAGGKRIRPILLLATIEAFGKDPKAGVSSACAVEMIHTYSLIHDDLPAMDDDDLRRGRPTNHKVYGEAMAILAGDALLTYSFQLISQDPKLEADKKIKLIQLLSTSSGPEGMVGGQVADMKGENSTLSLEELEYIHLHKTGELLSFSVIAGAIIVGASQHDIRKLKDFAYHIGLCFQIQDDILDLEGNEQLLGKPVGSDVSRHKSTYPSLLTIEGAKKKLAYHYDNALTVLHEVDCNPALLEQIAELIVKRDH